MNPLHLFHITNDRIMQDITNGRCGWCGTDDAMSKDMKKRGFKFFGTTICYAHLQASGFINDHLTDCICRKVPQQNY